MTKPFYPNLLFLVSNQVNTNIFTAHWIKIGNTKGRGRQDNHNALIRKPTILLSEAVILVVMIGGYLNRKKDCLLPIRFYGTVIRNFNLCVLDFY